MGQAPAGRSRLHRLTPTSSVLCRVPDGRPSARSQSRQINQARRVHAPSGASRASTSGPYDCIEDASLRHLIRIQAYRPTDFRMTSYHAPTDPQAHRCPDEALQNADARAKELPVRVDDLA